MRPAAGFAVLAIAVAVLAAWNLQLRADQDESRARLARTYEAISIMGQADQWWSVEAAEAAPEASGTLAYAAHRTAACLTVWGLPAEDGRAYHVWSVRDDVHIPAGTMWGIGAGKWIIMGGDIEEIDAVVITLEEAANPPVPQGPIVARVNLASP